MLDISPEKLVVVLLLASVVLGPSRLSQTARTLARLRGELRRLTSNVPPATLQAVRNPRGALLDVLMEQPDADRPGPEAPEP